MSKNSKYTDLNEPTSEIHIDQYYVVIGIEANNENAYQEEKINFSSKTAKHQFLSGPNLDWGHAFFYVVHNEKVFCFFSFGPSAGKKLGENKVIGNASTCQYPVSEVAQLYVLKINESIAKAIKIDVNKMYLQSNNEIYDEDTGNWVSNTSNDKKYRAITNETCAKEAYSILNRYLKMEVPNAYGYVKLYGVSKKAICPYAWNEHLIENNLEHHTYPEYPIIGKAKDLLAAFEFQNEEGFSELRYTYYLRTSEINSIFSENMSPEYTEGTDTDWILKEGDKDPLKKNGYLK